MGEFDLIRQFFTWPAPETVLAVGDDAALVQPRSGYQLAISADMLVAGRHFFADVDPRALGHKALAVNLSDMAAMGALPRWFTLSLALPTIDAAWLAAFSQGMRDLAQASGVELIGGDTTCGPLTIAIQICGEVVAGKALRRSGGQVDDQVWLSGPLGAAALAVASRLQAWPLSVDEQRAAQLRLDWPQPRLVLGQRLVGMAHAAIDISDGLLADLGHLCQASGCGALLDWPAIPQGFAALAPERLPLARQQECVLAGGDDYELCFTAPAAAHAAIQQLSAQLDLPLYCIGRLRSAPGVEVRDAQGRPMTLARRGFDHFPERASL